MHQRTLMNSLIVVGNYRRCLVLKVLSAIDTSSFLTLTLTLLIIFILVMLKKLKRNSTNFIFIAVLCMSLILNILALYNNYSEYTCSLNSNNELSKYITVSGNNINYELTSQSYNELENINSNLIGWVILPGSDINYPIVKDTESNYYKSHSFFGAECKYGCICLHKLDDSVVLYGNNKGNKHMFGYLTNYYTYPSMLTTHDTFYIALKDNGYVFNKYTVKSVMIKSLDYKDLEDMQLVNDDTIVNEINLVTRYSLSSNDYIFIKLELVL